MDNILSLKNYGVGIGEKVILSDVNLDVPEKGIVCLYGPSGVGKSTLLRTVSGLNESNPNLRTWGKALYAGEPLTSERPSMMMQSAKLMTATVLRNLLYEIPEKSSLDLSQQRELATRLLEENDLGVLTPKLYKPVLELDFYQNRHLSILRVCASSPRMICLDEPTTGLNDEDAKKIISLIKKQAESRAILVSLHNLTQAPELGGDTVLLAGGMIQETGKSATFFKTPKSKVTEKFAKTGSCSLPSPDAKPEDLSPDIEPPPPLPKAAKDYVSDSFGPRGFLWLKKGILAGTPKPGIFFDEEYDVKALQRVGINHLITLTQPPPIEAAVNTDLLKQYGIKNRQFPIPDMSAPSIPEGEMICQYISELISQKQSVAVHCRAGMGRTGTVLAMFLIWEGNDAITALETARKIEPRWVQSDTQVQFLEDFEKHLSKSNHLLESVNE